jgi:hypothetical protein
MKRQKLETLVFRLKTWRQPGAAPSCKGKGHGEREKEDRSHICGVLDFLRYY